MIYGAWLRVLEFLDLVGVDGRPSQSKLAAFTVLWFGITAGLYGMFWRGLASPSGAVVTLVVAGLAASFGRSVLIHFLARFNATAVAEDRLETKHETRPPHEGMDTNEADPDEA